jgi:hypothetical protein
MGAMPATVNHPMAPTDNDDDRVVDAPGQDNAACF